MYKVILFEPNSKQHVHWEVTTSRHPYVLYLDLFATTIIKKMDHEDSSKIVDSITLCAPHPEIVLMLMRSVQYNEHLQDTYAVCAPHVRLNNLDCANTEQLMLEMLKHNKMKAHCLEVFKYELWCTQKLHPMLRRMVPFIGPYIDTQDIITSLYKSTDSNTHKQHLHEVNHNKTTKTTSKEFCNDNMIQAQACLNDANLMYYTNPKQIPKSYTAFADASDKLFKTMRCMSPLWRLPFKNDDTRVQFEILQKQIHIVLDEYNNAVANEEV